MSRGARELCCRLNAGGISFRKVASTLDHAAGIRISPELLRQVVEEEGKRLLKASESEELGPGWKAADCKVPSGEGVMVDANGKPLTRVYLEMDGFMAPLVTDKEKQTRREQVVKARRKRGKGKPKLPPLPSRRKGEDQRYKEFKLVQFHDESMKHRLISVTRKNCKEAGRIMRRDARRIGFQEADQRIGLIDGGVWIFHQIMSWCVTLTALGLDFYHLIEQVNKARRAVFGPDSKEGGQWVQQALHAAKHEGYASFWERLTQWRCGLRSRLKRKDADQLLHYVSERKEMIRYDEFLAHDWRISSAPVESECGAVSRRIRGPGKRWDGDNAEAIMALEAADQSGQWNLYWLQAA